MRKLISLFIVLFLLVGCQEVFPGKYEMHCKHENANYSKEDEEHDFHVEFPIRWTTESITYAVDDYIIKRESHYEIELNKDAMDYYEKELQSDEELLVKKALEVLYFDFEEIKDRTTIKNSFNDDKLILDVTIESPERKKGWQGLIPPDEYSLSRSYKSISELKHTNISCEIVKE